MNLKRRQIKLLLPVAAAGIYLWCIWHLRYNLVLVPLSEIAKSEPHLTSFKLYVSFKAILLLLLLFLSAAVAISALLDYMRLSEGIAWYFVFVTGGAALSVPAGIRRSTSMEWFLIKEMEELPTVANVLTAVVVVLLVASVVVFICQIATERYRVRNLIDEILTTILSVYLLRLLTGIHNIWYLVAAVSVSLAGLIVVLICAYIKKLKTELEAVKKSVYNTNVDKENERVEEAL